MPENKPIQIVNSIVHAIEYQFAVTAVKVGARIKWPWLNKSIPGKVFDIIIDYVANEFYGLVSKFVAFTIIDIQVVSQKKEYEKTKDEFKKAIESGDLNAIQKAKAEFENAFARGIHFDGV